MNQSDQDHFQEILNNWCPKGEPFDSEPTQVRLARAFMQVSAYAADAARVMGKRDAIRDLDSYPNPLVGFEKIPERVKIKRENLVPGLDSQSRVSYAFQHMTTVLDLERRDKMALAVAEAILTGFERSLDIDSVESNRVFRSKHTRWFTDSNDTDIKQIIKPSGKPRISFDQISKIQLLVAMYVNTKDRKTNMMKEALDEAN